MPSSLLLLGYSSIASRRVIPAVRQISPNQPVDIASKSRHASVDLNSGTIFTDYTEALDKSTAETVYISLPNSMHTQWAQAALESGRHVIIDKPACITLKETEQLIEKANKHGRLIAEATVFSHHQQFREINTFFEQHGPLECVSAQFIIPPMPIENFRNHQHLGGGCLLDMGPYAAALVRLFGGGKPQEIHAITGASHADTGVDAGFSFLAKGREGVRITGHFGFHGEYQNRLMLMGKNGSIVCERIFSPPPDFKSIWQMRIKNDETSREIAADDSFLRFLELAFSNIKKSDYSSLAQDMLIDAEFRDHLTKLAGL